MHPFLQFCLLAGLAGGISLLYAHLIEPRLLVVRRSTLTGTPNTAPCRVVFFTDTHFRTKTDIANAKRLVRTINAQKPDVVLLGGDLFDNYTRDRASMDLKSLQEQLSAIAAPCGKFAVLGNHDYRDGARDHVLAFLSACGFTVLQNTRIRLSPLDLTLIGYDRYTTQGIPQELQRLQGDTMHLIVSHEPATVLGVQCRHALFFAGHTHGGQVLLPLLTRLVMPKGCASFRKGLYTPSSSASPIPLYVSSGIGTTRMPLRLFNPPEILVMELPGTPQ